jgi:RimJ/RimL family protein N-acetyltransferase
MSPRPPSAAIVPRIATARLLLREPRVDDLDAYAANAADPIASKFLSGVMDRRAAWRALGSMAGQWLLTGAGWWAVELTATGELVGTVGAFFRETQLGRGRDADLELGWTIIRAHWRKGYATEAARAALAHGLAAHDVRRAIAHVDPANAASVGVARAIGMKLDGEADFYGDTAIRYAIPRERVVPAR